MSFSYKKSIINFNGYNDADMSDEALLFYNYFFPEFKKDIPKTMRGDTMCSLGWTFGSENKYKNDFVRCRSYTKSFNPEEIKIFNSFKKGYHSLANFWIFPRNLNRWRGYDDNSYDGKNQNDYFDIFLNLIRDYYLEKIKLSSNIVNTLGKYENWLNQYGIGHAGWIRFVNKNFLNSFINVNYTVKDLFSKPEEFKSNSAPVVGTYHGYGWGLPGYTENPKESAINYAKNSLYVWEKRAELLKEVTKTMNITTT